MFTRSFVHVNQEDSYLLHNPPPLPSCAPQGHEASKAMCVPRICQKVARANTAELYTSKGELRDSGTLPTNIHSFRPCLAVHLWKWAGLEVKWFSGPGISVLSPVWQPRGSSKKLVSVLSDFTQQFTTLWDAGGWGNHIITLFVVKKKMRILLSIYRDIHIHITTWNSRISIQEICRSYVHLIFSAS
jgi:hypothetical protein